MFPFAIRLVLTILGSFLFLFIYAGNIFVIYAIHKHPHLHNTPNILLVSLAVADMLLALCMAPLRIMQMFEGEWTLGHMACRLHIVLSVFFCCASIMHMCGIAFDRYMIICHMWYYIRRRTWKTMMKIILLCYSISFLMVIQLFVHIHALGTMANERNCQINEGKMYVIYSTIGIFLLPNVFITIIYSRLFIKIRSLQRWKRERFLKGDTGNDWTLNPHPSVKITSVIPLKKVRKADTAKTPVCKEVDDNQITNIADVENREDENQLSKTFLHQLINKLQTKLIGRTNTTIEIESWYVN